jgi:hypothetical protein
MPEINMCRLILPAAGDALAEQKLGEDVERELDDAQLPGFAGIASATQQMNSSPSGCLPPASAAVVLVPPRFVCLRDADPRGKARPGKAEQSSPPLLGS